MNKLAAIAIVAVAAALGAGYWLGSRGGHEANAPQAAAKGEGGKPERKLLFYRNPMGLPDTSPVPKKDPMGMDYIAVYEGGDEGGAEGATRTTDATRRDRAHRRRRPMNGKTVAAVTATVAAALVVGYFVGRLGKPTTSKDQAASAPSVASTPVGEPKKGQRKVMVWLPYPTAAG